MKEGASIYLLDVEPELVAALECVELAVEPVEDVVVN